MTEDKENDAATEAHRDWNRPLPERLPRPTAWPLVLAFGACLLAWGVVTSWVIFVLGLVLFAAGVAGWIAEMRHDTNE